MPAPTALARRSALAAVLAGAALLAPATSLAATAGNELLVKFRSGPAAPAASQALAAVGGRELRTIPDIGVHVVSVPSGSAATALSSLRGSGNVAFAEPDSIATAQESVPNNPYFPQGSYGISAGAWGWYQTHTTQAWDLTHGDPSVIVAVLDTGLKTDGLGFGGQVVSPYNVLTGSTDVGSSSDNHGTNVAGVVGLAMNTASGNAGYCPACKLMPVQISNGSTAAYSDMATGVTWATDHGARIINLSWAGTSSSSTLANAVSYARSKGVVVFAAAGNSNCDCATYPSATPGVLGVGGVGQNGAKASDSNYGSWVALAAPEGNMTAWPTINGAPGYAPVGGTSLASPAAAGIAALVLSARPTLSGSQLEQTLESSATPASFTVRYGQVDAMAALRSLGFSDPQPAGAPVNTIAPQVLVETNADQNNTPLAAAPQAGDVLVRGQGAWTGSSPLNLTAVKWNRCNSDGSGCAVVGTSWKYTVQAADAGYALKVTVTFTDPDGTTTASSVLTAAVGGTPATTGSAPASSTAPAITGTAQAGATLTASSGGWSGAPTSYTYQWSRCDSAGANCSPISSATSQSYALGSADVGATARVAVTAANAYGSTSAGSAQTTVVAAAPPTMTTTIFTGTLSSKQLSQDSALAVGSGNATATLSFNKASSMTLTLLAPDGSTVGTVSGASGIQLTRTLTSGTYRYVVSGQVTGKGGASFTLTVTAPGS
jgi:hypothetical protein